MPKVAQQGTPIVDEDRSKSRCRIQGVRDLEEVGRVQPPTANSSLDPWPDVMRATDAHGRPFLDQPQRLIGLVKAPRDHDGIL